MSFPPIRIGSTSGTVADGGDMVSRDTSVSNAAYNQINTALSGTASNVRLITSRLQDRASVFDYPNIIGDGSHDDAPGLQVAINDCAGERSLLFPAGYTFSVNTFLTIPTGSNIIIDGTIFKIAMSNGATQFPMIVIIGSNITIELNGTIDGNKANQTVTGAAESGIVTWYAGSPYDFLNNHNGFNPTTGQSLYENISIKGQGSIQNHIDWPISMSISNSNIYGITMSNSSSAQLIYSQNSGFQNCIVHDITDDGLGIYQGNSFCFIDNCTIYNCVTGAFILSDDAGGATYPANAHCRITNNFMYNNTLAGIYVSGGSSAGQYAVAITISGNIVVNCGEQGAGQLDISNFDQLTCVGNVFRLTTGTSTPNALLGGAIQRSVISGNIFQGNGGYAVQVHNDVATNSRLLIESNVIFDNNGQVGIALDCVGSSGYITVRNNEYQGTFILVFQDNSATVAAVYEGYTTAGNPPGPKLFNTGLVIRSPTSTSGGIIIDEAGDMSLSGVFGALSVTTPTATISSTLTVSANSINFTNLPTTDPHVAGRLWNNNNVLTISAG